MNACNYIAVIADDLTGANDTALQFFMRGCSTQVAFGENISVDEDIQTEVFAMSTETRNASPDDAIERVGYAADNIIKKYPFEHIYKKIDSVLRGNFILEIKTVMEKLGFDAALICPAFPNEGRTTIGGFHLVKGIPLQRTEVSRDPAFPITESNIPNIIKNSLPDGSSELISLITVDTVMKGAGPILSKINEAISSGKKYIVVDAVSTTDVEQIALALTKCSTKILPCGSAGLAMALSNIWHPEADEEIQEHISLPKLPKLIVSGSATDLTASQIKQLKDSDSVENTYFIPVKPENIFADSCEELSQRILNNLVKENTVILYSSELFNNNEELEAFLIEHEITKEVFISKICDFLSAVTRRVLAQKDAFLITVGGETSYKCCRAAGAKCLRITDTVSPAIPLGIDGKGQYIVTKSGNLGNRNTLIEIIKYFEQDL